MGRIMGEGRPAAKGSGGAWVFIATFVEGTLAYFVVSSLSVPVQQPFAFGFSAGWLFLCQRLGFCGCWGLFLGSSVSLLFLLFRGLCAAVPVTLLACWAAVPRASLGNLFLAVGLSPSPFLLDPANDHGFVYNTKGQVDILQSPFFDFSSDVDHSVEEYVDRIIFQLAATIDVQLSSVQWLVDGYTKKSTNVMNLPIPTSSSGDEIFQVEESDGHLPILWCQASRFLSSNPLAFGFSAGWLFLCQRLGFCGCWGLLLGSSVSLLFLLFRGLCAVVPVTLLACWVAVPRASLGNLFLAVGLSPSPFLLG
ncbi:hypothetical protein M5K25_019493 [Dendrobium thyrsiflorum]|uniref:Uncharacterized protein n=1 Tax=Dendrobium thyrsiflorum TaxID=117978 RepID=A0ABD0UEW9_DENTH